MPRASNSNYPQQVDQHDEVVDPFPSVPAYSQDGKLYLAEGSCALTIEYPGWPVSRPALMLHLLSEPAGNQPNAADHDYVIVFAAGELAPPKELWSLSLYDSVTHQFIENPLNRYFVNSAMIGNFVFEDDGSLVIQVQKKSPGAARECNWLPAPDGTFYLLLRQYRRDPRVMNGEWNAPELFKSERVDTRNATR